MRRLVVAFVVLITVLVPKPAEAAGSLAGKIGFEGDSFGGWGLSVMRADGTGTAPLGAPAGAADLAWSPNAKRVAFEVETALTGRDVMIMDVESGALTHVTSSPPAEYWPVWFPNGKQLVLTVQQPGGPPQIAVVNADGSGIHLLTNAPAVSAAEPSVSPDGRRILFQRQTSQGAPPKVWVMNSDGTDQRPLTPADGAVDADPQWSPNGRQVVFSSNRTGIFEIWLMAADGSNAAPVAPTPGNDFAPTFSPDGHHIAWTKLRQGNGDVWIMRTDGGDVTRVTNAPSFEGFPDWAPGR